MSDRRSVWPELTLSGWEDTRDTLQLWAQIVGKVRLALEPMVNHWWRVRSTSRSAGLTTSLMPAGAVGLESRVRLRRPTSSTFGTTAGQSRQSGARPHNRWPTSTRRRRPPSASSACRSTSSAARSELPIAVPFDRDDRDRVYDGDAARRFWLALVEARRVLSVFHGSVS